jgi:transcriptional regulator with XRE-family HTH domain
MLLTINISIANLAGMQLSDWLAEKDQTQEAFAKVVGVTQGRIAQLLNGDLPSMALAMRIQDATGGAVALNDLANPLIKPPATSSVAAE